MKQIDIFYADDDDDDLMFFNEAIEKISTDTDTNVILHLHKNGESLIDNIKKIKDVNGVVFLDINMPMKTGFDLLQEIRNEPKIENVPVVMYSTSSNLDNINKSKALGANYYVIKPYSFANLLNMISTFVNMDWNNPLSEPNSFVYK